MNINLPVGGRRSRMVLAGLGGGVVGIVLAAVLLAALAVLLSLILGVSRGGEETYALHHVQALFVDAHRQPSARVTKCLEVGPGPNTGETLWRCQVSNGRCARALTFSVDHEYGTQPYDARAADAVDHLCGTRTH